MYSVKDPDVLNKIILLVGSQEIANNLYVEAHYQYTRLKTEYFNVQQVDGQWELMPAGISDTIGKSILKQ
jgi:hypothetical protein